MYNVKDLQTQNNIKFERSSRATDQEARISWNSQQSDIGYG